MASNSSLSAKEICPECWWGASSVHPTGVVRYVPEKCCNGFTLLSGEPMLVDMNGNLRHRWPGNGMPNRPLPGGRVLTSPGRWEGGQQDGIAVQEKDFNGSLLWEFRRWQQVDAIAGQPEEKGKSWIARQHHDVQRRGLPCGYPAPGASPEEDGPTLILAHRNIYEARIHSTLRLLDDVMYEVDRRGNITWQWAASEHLDELGFDDDARAAMQSYPAADVPELLRHAEHGNKPGDGFDWFHQNCASYVGPNPWFDAGDSRFHPDNVIINSREACLIAIVERKTGGIVWKVGPKYPRPLVEKLGYPIIGAHGAHIIPRGLPGEGHLLLFDNGGQAGYGAPTPWSATGLHHLRRGWSRVLEINPVSMEKVWEYRYRSVNPELPGHFDFRFFSPFVSFAQRLGNGNTLITVGDALRLIEVTPQGENVWEYLVPYQSPQGAPLIYRAYRLPYEWVPQIAKPCETAVVPPCNSNFHLPDAEGNIPCVHDVV